MRNMQNIIKVIPNEFKFIKLNMLIVNAANYLNVLVTEISGNRNGNHFKMTYK